MTVPENYIDFLHWFKSETELTWQNLKQSDDEQNDNWIIGAIWVGLKESEIVDIEKKYDLTFTWEHKEFLKVLHAIDKKRPIEYYNERNEIVAKQGPYLYNWLTDERAINHYLNWPYREILRDIKGGVWYDMWGKRPNSEKNVEKTFAEWFNKAPKLVPIHSHRFVVNIPNKENSPVLSV